ncbi:dihydrofolate reductase [Parafrigoribacterium soli]|uniref:dihydrofolate reductase n=1 Tax=Parafrigoribacterium soli TaxID=3144663 RepID=UPI0032EAD1D8
MSESDARVESRLIGLIWAQTPAGVIGKDNGMPWHVPEDLAHFKRVTMGHPVIMGRKSWDALPERWRPLPGRDNIVLTRNPSWHADGAIVVGSLEAALDAADDDDEVWIIGGEKVFVDAVGVANVVVVTELELSVEGDAFAPTLGPEWERESAEPADGWAVSTSGIRYRIVRYSKR